MKNLKNAYSKLVNSKSNVSTHYLISRSGVIFNLLCPSFKAWHAGVSKWKNINNLNDHSIGIELENKGHEYGYTYFSNKQYSSLKKIILSLNRNFYIKDENIIFHSDVSPDRKKDPGEKFFIKRIKTDRFKYYQSYKANYSIDDMLKIYGFSKSYITQYREFCIIAIKRSMNYKIINSKIDSKFKSNFYNFLFE